MLIEEPKEPLIETTFLGQPKAIVAAPRHIFEHLRDKGDLPFIEPRGNLKDYLDRLRGGRQAWNDELDRER